MPDEMERVPNAYQDTLLGRGYARAHLRQQGAILQAPQPEPQPMESGSLVGQPAPAGRSRLREQAEQQQRRYDEVLAEAFAASDAVDCRPPEPVQRYWTALERTWNARAAEARSREEHAAAVAKIEDDYFVRQSVPAGEHRRRYIEAHQRAAQRLQAAEALRAPTALGTYLQRVAEAASAAAASAWDQILDEWKRDFPLPKGDES